jgi:SEC-C motif domain protein
MNCPCDTGLPYSQCCERWHAGAPAPRALSLMRSRYSAYALNRLDYVLATWHASTRPASLQADPDAVRWVRLTIKAQREDGDQATVEFVAVSKTGGKAARLHEVSAFIRENGQWFYVDGVIS